MGCLECVSNKSTEENLWIKLRSLKTYDLDEKDDELYKYEQYIYVYLYILLKYYLHYYTKILV